MPGTFYKRPLLAMIVLSEASAMYVSEEEDSHIPSVKESEVLMKEIEGERKAARRITGELKRFLDVVDAEEELGKGEWWDRGTACDLKDALTP